MENKSHAVAAGVFVLSLIVVLGILAVWLTADRGSYATYELSTPQAVTGLQPQAPVRYKGVAVGRVEYIGFDDEREGNVLIRISVSEDTPVQPTTYASLGYQGVTGLAYIDLDDAPRPIPDLGQSSRGYKRLAMRPSNLSQLAAMGPEVIGDVRQTMASINALLDAQNREVFVATLANIGAAAQNTASLVENINRSWAEEIRPTIDAVSRGLGSNMQAMERAANSIDAMSREIAQLTARVGAENGPVDQLGEASASFAAAASEINLATLPRVQRTLEDISAAMRELSRLARGIEQNPQSFIFGPDTSRPGPGEPGYVAPGR
ncbi:hypothetical protein AAV94_05425 [Lampropedia cohaerens]|uniref:Mce/MlaD domain-containing protein n=1 Tax=Lampropedia cohaerens TaxID=1610491 RepID=A0A0U1Q0L0_9BURK|nr:MlaD family protein [Lampropedia cohaerens]KKW68271.1 hypothetical protein AAV94_05425 [Lampropedia cohaerens]